jgi:hypothetical protein
MARAEFWINRHPFPDKVILDSRQIEAFNSHIATSLKLTKDIAALPSRYPGGEFMVSQDSVLEGLAKRRLYLKDGRPATRSFYKKAREDMNLEAVDSEIDLGFGLVTHRADQRLLPTEDGLYARRGEFDFDEVANSALDVGTPLAILKRSSDGAWLYAFAPSSSGWVEAKKVALCPREEVADFLKRSPFLIVIKAKSDIFLDRSLAEYYDCARMGVRLPLASDTDSGLAGILLPVRREDGSLLLRRAYLKAREVREGYLPYTPRNIFYQAFELLNAPYGWGGRSGGIDCSDFIRQVFATVGIILPRNSKEEAQVGLLVGEYGRGATKDSKIRTLAASSVGGITLLCLRGHIMLFLGMANGRPYAIHALWAFEQKVGPRTVVRPVGRVAVTGLSLGEGSKKGSLLERIYAIRMISAQRPRKTCSIPAMEQVPSSPLKRP